MLEIQNAIYGTRPRFAYCRSRTVKSCRRIACSRVAKKRLAHHSINTTSPPASGDTPKALAKLGYAYARAGRTNEAWQFLEKLKSIWANNSSAFGPIAFLHLGLGDLDQAFVWFERGVESRDLDPRAWWKVGPLTSDLIKDPRYPALVKKFGLDN